MGLDTAAIQQQLASGSLTRKAAASGSGNGGGNAGADYTQLQTHGYCLQEVAAGQAAKARCLQAMAGRKDPGSAVPTPAAGSSCV